MIPDLREKKAVDSERLNCVETWYSSSSVKIRSSHEIIDSLFLLGAFLAGKL